ncbi:cytochrome P450 [Jimgerdemannia flammicorona]|uniref:Cytochrome P450 n=1 Tax=Jimgerdemannia flammicorona TaxID=994334 RepID=A0A433DL27_9FUNG|nr:cytochrome P450 [Jimgerdemannia flammicorona]
MDTTTFHMLKSWAFEFLSSFVGHSGRGAAVQSAAAVVASYVVVARLYDAFFGPLSDVPGPLIHKLLDLPVTLPSERGSAWKYVASVHERYGPVVRIGRNVISVADKEMLKQILVKEDLPKSKLYKQGQRMTGRQTLFNTIELDFHKQRRRILSPAFSISYLNSLEPYIFQATESLVRKLRAEISVGTNERAVVDIWNLLQRLALDIIGETAFGRTFGMIENGSHPLPQKITESMRRRALIGQFPFLGLIPALTRQDPLFQKFVTNIIEDRVKSGIHRSDILQILIDAQYSKESDDRLDVKDIISETVLFLYAIPLTTRAPVSFVALSESLMSIEISPPLLHPSIAGSETTSNSTGFAIIYLLRHPDKLQTLIRELDTQLDIPVGDLLPSHDSLKHLPYLNAVINETMRLRPVSAMGLPREPAKDVMLGHYFVPRKTLVIANMRGVQINPDYWPNPTEFMPERFLEGAVPGPAMDAFYPFSAGSRNCIGKNFAWMEMRLILATLFKYFEFDLIPSEMPKADDLAQFVTLTIRANEFNVGVRVRKEAWEKVHGF